MKTRSQIIVALALVLVALGAVAFSGMGEGPQEGNAGGMEGHDHSAMSAGTDEAQPVTLAPGAGERIGVTFARVTRGTLPATVETVGFVTYDETRLTVVNPKIQGWVERLMVDFTGAPVRAGQPLMEVYSPALVTAQEELLLARRLLDEARARGGERSVQRAEELLEAARRRLAYWDIPEEEIQALEEGGEVSKTLTLRAPAGGIVVEKNVVEGARISDGADLFRIADLNRVWVDAEVFEKDLALVEEGQHAMVRFEAYPGEAFHGSVSYVYPTVSQDTRTGRVRLELPNPGLKIKPGMYAKVEIHGAPGEETLLVPRGAVLETGERSVVFHRMSNGQLHPMEVVTGRRDQEQIQILSGISEGQTVVASATFLIDAESNLASAMAGMAGMDHSGMDMGGGAEMDHSGHDMGGAAPDTAGDVDHSQMDHSGHEMSVDTSGSTMDHSGHDMSGMVPDTTGAGSHEHHHEGPGGRGL